VRKLWKWLLDWWEPPAVRVEIEGFFLEEERCLYCGNRWEILAAEITPDHKRIRHGCRSCQKNGNVINTRWIEI
jgi:hypothetical protein